MSKPLTLLFLVLSCLFCSCEFVFLWNNFHIDSHKISGLCGHMLSFLYLTEQKAKKAKKSRFDLSLIVPAPACSSCSCFPTGSCIEVNNDPVFQRTNTMSTSKR